MALQRKSGILAHPTSFPSLHGIGDLGAGAYEFIDFLRESGAGLWQTLPLGPTGFGDSPYQSFCAFAGNPLLISPELLVKDGLLEDVGRSDGLFYVDYGAAIEHKTRIFEKAYANFKKVKSERKKFVIFQLANKEWLDDYTLFVAIKNDIIAKRRYNTDGLDAYHRAKADIFTENQINDRYYGAVWNTWPDGLKRRDKSALDAARKALSKEIEFCGFLQYCFFKQWNALKTRANSFGIKIIGDMPIFVPEDSSDVWANPHLFQLDKNGEPTRVAGVPPDYFSETGQLWGNPVYDWSNHQKSGYAWWIKRVAQTLETVDILRIDHFRGFDEYWAVPHGEKTAVNGEWLKGPGAELFTRIKNALGNLPVIAEDLGVMTASVENLRDGLELPGMKILQFGFEGGADNLYLPHNITSANTVLYTGTHDNDTTVGWYEKSSEAVKDHFRRYMNTDASDPSWDLIRLAYASAAAFVIIPIQDVLRLGSDARMNTPGTPSGNWRFRYTRETLAGAPSDSLLYLAKLFNRLNDAREGDEKICP